MITRLDSISDVDRPDDRIRILKVVTNFTSGGTEGQVHNLVRHIDHSRFAISFASLKKYGHFLEEVEQLNLPVNEFPIKSYFKPSTLFQFFRLVRYMRRHQIQISHSYNFYSNIFAIPAARLAGVPVILASIRDRGVYLSPAQKRVQKFICRMADGILVNADAIRDWLLEEGYSSERITVIKNGIDLSLYDNVQQSSNIREELGLPASTPLVIMMARVNPQKGYADLLNAIALMTRDHHDAHFLVVGEELTFAGKDIVPDNNYHDALHKLSIDLGVDDRVHFLGHRKDIPNLLSQVSLSVLPSHSEGLSNSLLESMAASLPIVATRVGGNPELVEDGVNGILVPPHEPQELATAMARILGSPKTALRFSKASRRLSKKHFDMKVMVSATESYYTAITGEIIANDYC